MTALPPSSDFTASTVTEGGQKVFIDSLRLFLVNLLGADGTVATALGTLGALGGVYAAKTAAYTVTLADRGQIIDATAGTWSLGLPAVASAGTGFSVILRNSGSGTITVDPSGAELVDGATTLAIPPSRAILLTCTGTAWLATWMATAQGAVLGTAQTFSAQQTFSAGVLATAGSAAAPGYAIAGDTNTGIYGVSADVLGLATGGVQRAFLSSTVLELPSAVFRSTVPSDANAGATAAFFTIGTGFTPAGQLDSHSGNEVTLTSNGYRDSSSLWHSYAVASNTGAAQVAVSPLGYISLRAETTKATGAGFAVAEVARAYGAGQFGVVAGTVSLPAYTFLGDAGLDTGLYWVSQNNFAAANGGLQTMLFTATQAALATGLGGLGYGTGAGGAVSQITSRTTGVTINKPCGAITMFSAAGSATPASFVVTNSAVAATDVIDLCVKSGATNIYNLAVTAVGTGSFTVTFWTTGGTATDAPVINFSVCKAVTS